MTHGITSMRGDCGMGWENVQVASLCLSHLKSCLGSELKADVSWSSPIKPFTVWLKVKFKTTFSPRESAQPVQTYEGNFLVLPCFGEVGVEGGWGEVRRGEAQVCCFGIAVLDLWSIHQQKSGCAGALIGAPPPVGDGEQGRGLGWRGCAGSGWGA